MLDEPTAGSYLVYLVKLSCTMFKEDPFMKATSSELLMRNFNKIFIELDAVKRAALLAESYTEDCLWIHPGGRIVGRDPDHAQCSDFTVGKRDARSTFPLHGNRLPRRARWSRVKAVHVH